MAINAVCALRMVVSFFAFRRVASFARNRPVSAGQRKVRLGMRC